MEKRIDNIRVISPSYLDFLLNAKSLCSSINFVDPITPIIAKNNGANIIPNFSV